MFRRELVRRIAPNAAFFFLVWPLASAFAATIQLKSQSATALLPWGVTFGMLMRAEPALASEWFFVAALAAAASIFLFAATSPRGDRRPASAGWLLAEPFLLVLAAVAGIATEYPAVLAHPFLKSLRSLPVLWALLLLTTGSAGLFALFGYRGGGRRGALAGLAAFAVAFGASAAVSRSPAARRRATPSRASIVLLGIDSLSQADDLARLRGFTSAHGGTWYSNAVSPGLVTNAVWTAILQHRPVRETGVWTICMEADWRRAPFNLVAAANRAGFRTRSYFSDQFTSYVGSEAGFDENRSGPLGWLQLATASLKENSVFLPVALARLPPLPGARTPRNQSGTFAFDIPAELDEVFSGDGRPTFSAGHLDYLHQPLYPRFDELTPDERRRVLSAPVSATEDLSFDWQYPTIPGDALGIYRWKVRHVQEMVAGAIERSGFFDPARANRLVVFSDHGSRRDLTVANFDRRSYWNVPLAAFGAESPADPARPVSLLAIPRMLGFPDPTRPAPDAPSVEFAGVDTADIPRLAPYFLPDGRVLLDPRVLERIGARIHERRLFAQ